VHSCPEADKMTVDLLVVVVLDSILWQIKGGVISLVIYYGVGSKIQITHIIVSHQSTHAVPSLFILIKQSIIIPGLLKIWIFAGKEKIGGEIRIHA
jgi:hypothetical protein